MLRNLCASFGNQLRSTVSTATLHTSAPVAAAAVNAATKYINVCEVDGVREITLDDPKTLNSLSLCMMERISEALTRDRDNAELRAIVLSATGRVWSSGHNLKELASVNEASQTEIFNRLIEIIRHIRELPVPVIAKVNGLVAAGGCQLVASCDMVVCTDTSSFSTPAANVGIFATTPGIAMSRVMPRLKSSYMLLTGLPITAQQANVAGLVSTVVPEVQLDEEMLKITNAIKSKSRAVIALGKQFYYDQLSMDVEEAYCKGTEKMMENLSLADGKEGLKSFVEKRKPKWLHKL